MSTTSAIASAPPVAPTVDLRFANEALDRLGRAPDQVIPVLQALQDHYGYLPREALDHVCRQSQITPASITGVATFYDMFRHEPVGRHIFHVFTARPATWRAERVEDALRRHLHIPEGTHTDAQRQFTSACRLPRLLYARPGGPHRRRDPGFHFLGEGPRLGPRLSGQCRGARGRVDRGRAPDRGRPWWP
jgi:hypothetical protein